MCLVEDLDGMEIFFQAAKLIITIPKIDFALEDEFSSRISK